jgi:hypothetical protein
VPAGVIFIVPMPEELPLPSPPFFVIVPSSNSGQFDGISTYADISRSLQLVEQSLDGKQVPPRCAHIVELSALPASSAVTHTAGATLSPTCPPAAKIAPTEFSG